MKPKNEIRFQASKNYDDSAEVCKLASEYGMFVYRNQWTGGIILKLERGEVPALMEHIRTNLTSDNQFKNSDDKRISTVIRRNYKLVEMYTEVKLTKWACKAKVKRLEEEKA